MTSPIASKGSPLSSIFSPYKAGTTKARATGLYENNVDLCNLYANIIYGSAAPATGIKSENADLNTLFCTGASYKLPIDGQTYAAAGNAASGLVQAVMTLQMVSNGTYQLVASGTNSSGQTWTFSNPSGVTQYYYTITYTGGTVTENVPPSTWTALPSSGTPVVLSFKITSTNQGTKEGDATLNLYMGSGGVVMYSGTCTLKVVADSGA